VGLILLLLTIPGISSGMAGLLDEVARRVRDVIQTGLGGL